MRGSVRDLWACERVIGPRVTRKTYLVFQNLRFYPLLLLLHLRSEIVIYDSMYNSELVC